MSAMGYFSNRALVILAFLLLVLPALGSAQTAGAQRVEGDAAYREIASRLDTGGNLYIVANVGGVIEGVMSNAVSCALSLSGANPDTQPWVSTLTRLGDYLKRNGFYGLEGFGMSVVPGADGLSDVKCFIRRHYTAASSPLWMGIVGGVPRQLECINFLPDDASMVRAGNNAPAQLWKLVSDALDGVGGGSSAVAFKGYLARISAELGRDPDAIAASLGEEVFVSVQLSKTASVEIAGAAGKVRIPQPSILVGAAVKDDSLAKAVEKYLSTGSGTNAVSLGELRIGDVIVKSGTLSASAPFPFQPSFATCRGFFLFGSSPEVLKRAILARERNDGLAATKEFKDMFRELPAVNNGLFYTDKLFSKVMADLRRGVFSISPPPGQSNAGLAAILSDMVNRGSERQVAMVIVNYRSGVLIRGRGTAGGGDYIGSFLMAPIGMISAAALPAMIRGRDAVQYTVCVGNLKALNSAKDNWALLSGKREGDAVDAKGLLEFLPGGLMPVCPAAGAYSIEPLGKKPVCSAPGHVLP